MKKIGLLIPVIAVVIIGVSAWKLIAIYSEYGRGEAEYHNLQAAIITREKGISGNKEAEPFLQIDFAKLSGINKDVIGWISYAPLAISHPVVQGTDNEYYTHYTFEKEKNSMASIFVDCNNAPDFTDYNTIIYGHNMKNGTMFGSLKKMAQNLELCRENPNIIIYREDGIYTYKILAFYYTDANSSTYDLCTDEKQYQEYQKMIQSKAVYYNEELENEMNTEEPMITLSTCSGSHSTNRLVVHALLQEN